MDTILEMGSKILDNKSYDNSALAIAKLFSYSSKNYSLSYDMYDRAVFRTIAKLTIPLII